MKRQVILAVTVAVTACFASSVSAQSSMTDLKMMKAGAGPATNWQQPDTMVWLPIARDTSKETISELLKGEGWSEADIGAAITPNASYDLFKMNWAPGMNSYLAVPDDKQMESAVQFGAAIPKPPTATMQASWFGAPSAEEIRKQIVQGLQSSIEALCEMPARPATIRAQASAFGIVEIEATWTSGEVCEPRQR